MLRLCIKILRQRFPRRSNELAPGLKSSEVAEHELEKELLHEIPKQRHCRSQGITNGLVRNSFIAALC